MFYYDQVELEVEHAFGDLPEGAANMVLPPHRCEALENGAPVAMNNSMCQDRGPLNAIEQGQRVLVMANGVPGGTVPPIARVALPIVGGRVDLSVLGDPEGTVTVERAIERIQRVLAPE